MREREGWWLCVGGVQCRERELGVIIVRVEKGVCGRERDRDKKG